jgi:hypothetical protein
MSATLWANDLPFVPDSCNTNGGTASRRLQAAVVGNNHKYSNQQKLATRCFLTAAII